MLNEKYLKLLNQKSVIREMYMYGLSRAKIVGVDNVFDFSLGNPSVEAPKSFNSAIKNILESNDSINIHGYSPTLGIDTVRERVAKSLNERFNMDYRREHIFMTSGAASAIAHALRAVTTDNDEVITFAPYFPEYQHYVGGSNAKLVVVKASESDFQINFDAFIKALNPKVMAVLINTPNNPSGIVYSEETIIKLTNILKEKSLEYNHDIYLISDEPYREIVFSNVLAPYVSKYYDNTISCYSFSKSLSIPGERIGYVAVNPNCRDSKTIVDICGQISRGIGHNCPTSLIQYAMIEVVDQTSDLHIYEKNMEILYENLISYGYEIVKPGGTFYMFPKALEDDAVAFCNKAKELDLLLVPSDSFGVKGHFRIAYCVPTEKVVRSLEKFKQLALMYKK